MKVAKDVKHELCSLFEVNETSNGGWSVVTPMQYSGSNDNIVVCVDRSADGWLIHENGEATLNANMLGFDAETETIERWAEELKLHSPVRFDGQTELLSASTDNEMLLAPYIFRVAEASQQLFTLATQRQERRQSTFKKDVTEIVAAAAARLGHKSKEDVELPIAGGLVADLLVDQAEPLIVVAATSVNRLMEAELIFLQYRLQGIPGFVLAVAETGSIPRKQFDRANYYTGKTVNFDRHHLEDLVKAQLH